MKHRLSEETRERLDLLEAAANALTTAIDLITEATEGTEREDAAQSYIIGNLVAWRDGENRHDDTAIPYLAEAIADADHRNDHRLGTTNSKGTGE
jgi:hypothetical protein